MHTNTQSNRFEELKTKLLGLAHLSTSIALLEWDMQVNMPAKGAAARAATMSHLQSLYHQQFCAINNDGLLDELIKLTDTDQLTDEQITVVKETHRQFARSQKLPDAFVEKLSRVTAEAHAIWAEARSNNSFKTFLPHLEEIISLKQQEAAYVGYTDSPYDALLDTFEPNMTSQELSQLFNDLKDSLVPLLKRIVARQEQSTLKSLSGKFPVDKQTEFNKALAESMGYDLEAGRLDVSTHPFSMSCHPLDSRITTRYDEQNILYSIMSTIHEVGHALYEQGLPPEHFGTPLAEAISMGLHESQSKIWETNIGSSRPFWQHFYPLLQNKFPKQLNDFSLDDFYQNLNQVKPSLIRTEADEVTYNLHITIRYELEKELIEGTIKAADLPEIWKSRYHDYLGITVPDDRVGVLQDVHWSAGYFGYFPSYTLGTLYAAQFYNTMQVEVLDLEATIAEGHFDHALQWLRTNIHKHGKSFSADTLVRNVTGEPLNSHHFIAYLKRKYLAHAA